MVDTWSKLFKRSIKLSSEYWPKLFKSWIALPTGKPSIQWISIRETNCAIHWIEIYLAPVVKTLDSVIHRINHYLADEYWGN